MLALPDRGNFRGASFMVDAAGADLTLDCHRRLRLQWV